MSASPNYSHPDLPVRHSYPLHIKQAGFMQAFSLLMKTLPYALVRFGILVAATVISIIWFGLSVGGLVLLSSKIHPWVGYGWLAATAGVYGYLWWFVVRYMLYLIKCGHIAVLTELITSGSIDNGNEGMFAYGKRIVTERFGQVNILFAVDVMVHGVVRAFNRTLDFVASLLPIPGLNSVMAIVNAVIYAATTYIDETILSYSLARNDSNAWSTSKDGLIYYCQNVKPILKTSIGIVIADKVLTVVLWVVMLAPAFAIAYILPDSVKLGGSIVALAIAALFASNFRNAFLKPLFLIMIMTKFHTVVQNQEINLVWDERLTKISGKFKKLKDKAFKDWRGKGDTIPPQPAQAGDVS